MPVDDEINLDNPEGLTQEQFEIMNREAQELANLAEGAERNAEKLKRATDSLKGMDMFTKNIVQSEVQGKPNDMSTVDIVMRVNQLEQQLQEVSTHVIAGAVDSKENVKRLDNAKEHRMKLETMLQKGFSEIDKDLSQVINMSSNPFQFARGKLMGFVGKAGVAGAIIGTVVSISQKLWEQYEKSFKAGGVNDIRKMMDARDKEMAELDDILKRRNGEVFFTAETTLKQGNPYSSNTSLLADQVLRYQALHLGE